MSVELKNISPIVADDDKGESNPAFVSTESVSTVDLEPGLRQRKGKADVDEPPHIDRRSRPLKDYNVFQHKVMAIQSGIVAAYKQNNVWIWRIIKIVLAILYLIYFGFAMAYRFGDEGSIRLLVITVIAVAIIVLNLVWDTIKSPFESCSDSIGDEKNKKKRTIVKWVLYAVATIGIIIILVLEVALVNPSNLISLGGLAAYIVLCYVCSRNPGQVDWHPVFWGLVMQFYFAFIILRNKWGFDTFQWLGDRVTSFLAFTDAGSSFVFGDLQPHFFAFKILPVVTFFSAFISITYYLGAMQAIVKVIGRTLAFCLGTTPAESLNAAGNIFVGMTEAPLMIRPFLDTMTISELHAVMTGGFATIAGSVLGAYIGFGVPPNHLLSASVMSAPAALAISKLLCPETEISSSSAEDYNKMKKGQQRNLIEAAFEGATMSIMLIANIAVNLIAFLALLAFVNATLSWFGDRVGVEGVTFEWICSYVLYPLALFMGTPPSDCRLVAELVGVKTFGNEFVAYRRLQGLLINRQTFLNYTVTYNQSDYVYYGQDVFLSSWNQTLVKGFMSERSEVISTYALCGFANVGSMGILLGGLAALAPKRQHDLSSIVLRAMIAGNLASFFTACIAGLFFTEF